MSARPWDCGEVEDCAKDATRFGCARKAARWCHVAASESRLGAVFALRWAATWRAAGKTIPRRIGMVCARSRREHRRGFRLRARDEVTA